MADLAADATAAWETGSAAVSARGVEVRPLGLAAGAILSRMNIETLRSEYGTNGVIGRIHEAVTRGAVSVPDLSEIARFAREAAQDPDLSWSKEARWEEFRGPQNKYREAFKCHRQKENDNVNQNYIRVAEAAERLAERLGDQGQIDRVATLPSVLPAAK